MAAGVYNFDITRGDYFHRHTFVLSGPDDPLSFAGWTAKAQARAAFDADEVVIDFDCGIDDDGNPWIEADGDKTAGVGALSELVWDLELTDPDGKPYTWLGGTITIDKDVTR